MAKRKAKKNWGGTKSKKTKAATQVPKKDKPAKEKDTTSTRNKDSAPAAVQPTKSLPPTSPTRSTYNLRTGKTPSKFVRPPIPPTPVEVVAETVSSSTEVSTEGSSVKVATSKTPKPATSQTTSSATSQGTSQASVTTPAATRKRTASQAPTPVAAAAPTKRQKKSLPPKAKKFPAVPEVIDIGDDDAQPSDDEVEILQSNVVKVAAKRPLPRAKAPPAVPPRTKAPPVQPPSAVPVAVQDNQAQQYHPIVPFQIDENKKIVLSTKDTSLGGLLPASVILNNYLKLDPKEFTAMLENSKKMVHFLLSDIDINDPHAVIVKTMGRMEYLITRNRSLVQVLSSMQKALFECNERLTEKETRCETLHQQVREQTEAFRIEWKTSYEGTLKKAVEENKSRQDYFLHNDFEHRLEQQKAEYEKSVATYEKDRKDLIKENANLRKDKDNLEKQLSAFKKREKQFLSLLRQHKIKGPDSDDDDSEDDNDDDDDDEDWDDVEMPEVKSKSKSEQKSKVKVSKIEPKLEVPSPPAFIEDQEIEDQEVEQTPEMDDNEIEKIEPPEVEKHEEVEDSTTNFLLTYDPQQYGFEPTDIGAASYHDMGLEHSVPFQEEEESFHAVDVPNTIQVDVEHQMYQEDNSPPELDSISLTISQGNEPIAVAASIPQPAEDNVVYSSASLLEADLSLSDSEEEEGFGVDYSGDLDSECSEQDKEKVAAHLIKHKEFVEQIVCARDPNFVPGPLRIIPDPAPKAPRPTWSPSKAPPTWPEVPKMCLASQEPSSIKDKLKKDLNAITAVNAAGKMCEKKRLEAQIHQKKSSPKQGVEGSWNKDLGVIPAKPAETVTLNLKAAASSSTLTNAVTESKAKTEASSICTKKRVEPDIEAGTYQSARKTRISHVKTNDKSSLPSAMSGSESEGKTIATTGIPTSTPQKRSQPRANSIFSRIQKGKGRVSKSMGMKNKRPVPVKSNTTNNTNQQQLALNEPPPQNQLPVPPQNPIGMDQTMFMMNTCQMMYQMFSQLTEQMGIANPIPSPFGGVAPMIPPNLMPMPVVSAQVPMPIAPVPVTSSQQQSHVPLPMNTNLTMPPSSSSVVPFETSTLSSDSESEEESAINYDSPQSPSPMVESDAGSSFSKGKGASCKSEWIDARKTRCLTNQAAGIITELLMHSEDEIIKTVGLTENFKFLASLPPRNVVVALYEHLIKNCGNLGSSLKFTGVALRVGQTLCIMDVLSKGKDKLMENGKTIYDLMYAYMLDEIIPCRKVQFKDIIELYAIGGFLGYALKIQGVGKIDDVIWKCLFWRPPDAITIFMALFRVNSDYYNEFDFNDKSRPLRDRVAAFCIERMPVHYQSSRHLELRMFVNKALNWKNVPKDMQIKDLFETIMPEIMGMEHEKALEMATDILTFICVIYGHESFPYFRDQLIKVTQRWMAHEVNDGVYAAVIRAIGEMAKKSIEVLTPAQLKPLKEFLETASQHNENSVVVKDAYAVALVNILTTSNNSKTRKQVVFPLLVKHQSKKSPGKRPTQKKGYVRRGGKRGWGRGGRGGGGSSGTKN